jgi:hypothetical protein
MNATRMTHTIGVPFRYSSHSWMRRDTWPTGDSDALWCAGPLDQSPVVLGQGYDARCALCWLHHTHTEDLHQQRVAQTHTQG